MRWENGRESSNVEDRRGAGGGGGMRRGVMGGGIGVFVIAIIAMFLGVDPSVIFGVLGGGGGPMSQPQVSQQAPAQRPPAEDKQAKFVSVVLADTEDTWRALFKQNNAQYRDPKLVLFRGAVNSACGHAQAAMGPFYCPADEKVYIDLQFFDDLHKRFRAPGDFAQAYVIAHEIGHHVQHLLGITGKVHAARQRLSEVEYNKLSVRLELQADCLAGFWAHHAHRTRQILEQGDVEEALGAASAIGDDRLQMQSRGYVTPESFNHGTSAQRVRWFKRGLEGGQIRACNTFEAREL
ncbi:MAG: metalloprotease [Betaproteobacteria bacterium]|nr:metalloprotease [Betaproteobacteria bacterium]